MKRLSRYGLVVFVFLPFSVKAQVLSINQFSGINTDDAPLTLQNGQTPDSQNVVTDDGPGLKGRLGYINFSTEPSSGNIWEFPLSNGTRYMITQSGGNLKATTSGVFSILIGTVPTDRVISAAVLGDKFFYVDTLNGLKYWDGATVTTSSKTMTFSMLVTFKGRLAGAGISGNQRTIYLSKYLDGTNWTLVTNPSDDDPTQIGVSGSLDENIQALYSTFQDKLMYFKKNSFGGLSGSRRSNFSLRVYSDGIGVASIETIKDCDGRLRWMGNNKKIYEFDGSNFGIISQQIDNLTDTIIQGDANSASFTQTSAGDWNSDSFDWTTYVDTGTNLGTISSIYPDSFSTYRDGNSGTKKVWRNELDDTNCPGCSTNFSSANDQLEARCTTNGANDPSIAVSAVSSTTISPTGTTYYMTISSLTTSTSGTNPLRTLYFTLNNSPRNNEGQGVSTAIANNSFFTQWASTKQLNGAFSIYLQGATHNGTGINGPLSGPFAMPISFSFFITPSTYQFTINGSSVVKTGSHTFPASGPIYPRFDLDTSGNVANGNTGPQGFNLSDFSVTPQTFTVTSIVKNIPNVTSWGSFSSVDTGSNTYSIRASSVSTLASTTFTFTNILSGNVPTVPATSYFQIRDYMIVNTTNSQTSLSQFTQNWNEGSSIRASAGYIGQRYWLGVSISSTSNNRILIRDKSNQWQLYSGYVPEVMGLYNSRLYVGNTNGIFLSESSYADNGIPITSYYTTNTLAPSGIDLISQYQKLYLTSNNSDDTLTPTFQIDENGTYNSLGNIAMNLTNGMQNIKFPFSVSDVQQGRFINMKWSITGSSFWRILNGNIYFNPGIEPE